MITPHTIVGAAVGSVTGNSGVAFLLGFLSHHLLDALPHIDLNNFYHEANVDRRYNRLDYLVIGLDALVAVLVLWVFFRFGSHGGGGYWWGALGGITPDLIDNHPWRQITRQWPLLKQYHRFHHWFHLPTKFQTKYFALAMTVQILVVLLGIFWLAR